MLAVYQNDPMVPTLKFIHNTLLITPNII